ncbi:hypothetical protein CHS0354_008514 [Potamilus streckersoni]|uniref:CARD domain-containing protein n=1 Tax=Potamilus streckersoni TaxID=2493646 RepID=A0AAE0VQJ5_9BIVA|nr:hypothetical protein CHS0354_008514 [Potamilus streckersoni]
MNDIQREALKKNTIALVQDIMVTESFLAALDEKKIFEQEMLEMIKVERTTSDKVYKLLDLLPRRGPEAFNSFLLVLEDHYDWLATKLRDTHQELMNQKTTQPGQSDILVSPENIILDKDIKQQISSFIQRQLGQVRRISNTDKSSIERWLGEWAQEERRRLMQIFQKTHVSDDERILEKPIVKKKLYKLHTKLASAAHRSNKNERKLGAWTLDTITFEAIEEQISTLMGQCIDMALEIDQCYAAFGAKPGGDAVGLNTYAQRMLALVKEKEAEIAQEKQKVEEMLYDMYKNVSEQKKKDQALLQNQKQMMELTHQVKALQEENSRLEFQVTSLDRQTKIHAEKEKTLGELRQHKTDMQVLIKILRDENQDLKLQINAAKVANHKSPNRGMNVTRNQRQSRQKQNTRKKTNILNGNKT